MTTLHNSVTIAAPRSADWHALTRLDGLATYDPRVKSATLARGGLGTRRCVGVRASHLLVLAMRRKWDSGIKGFLAGLKGHIEAGDFSIVPS